MAKKHIILLLIFFNLFIFIPKLKAYLRTNIIQNNSLIEKVEFGEINWTSGVLTIYGEKRLPEIVKNDSTGLIKKYPGKYAPDLPAARQMAKEMALQKARQNLYNALLNLRIKNDFYIKSYLENSTNDFKFHLNNLISDKIIPKYIYKDNSIKVRMRLQLFKEKGVITLFTNQYEPVLIEFCTKSNYKNYIKKMIKKNNSISQAYSSLIIDATELKNLFPALFPAIYNRSGKEVFCSKIIPADKVVPKGMVRYIPDIRFINNYKFVDSKAYIIKAIRTKNKTDLILPDEELKQFLSSEETVKHLQNCNIIIIIQP